MSPQPAKDRQWLQFRLRSLLLVPVLVGLVHTFSDQPYDHFMLRVRAPNLAVGL